MREQNEKCDKEIENIKDLKVLALKSIELKNPVESFKTRLNHSEERISNMEDRTFEIIQWEEQQLKE